MKRKSHVSLWFTSETDVVNEQFDCAALITCCNTCLCTVTCFLLEEAASHGLTATTQLSMMLSITAKLTVGSQRQDDTEQRDPLINKENDTLFFYSKYLQCLSRIWMDCYKYGYLLSTFQ